MIITITGIQETKYGSLVYFLIQYNGLEYEWCDYIFKNTFDTLQEYFDSKIPDYTIQIDTMELEWAAAPKTKMIDDGMGGMIEVPVLKTEYVHPILKDYDSLRLASIEENLPSWAIINAKFNSMLAKANAATNLAQAKAVLIDIIGVLKKSDRVVYWLAKNKDE